MGELGPSNYAARIAKVSLCLGPKILAHAYQYPHELSWNCLLDVREIVEMTPPSMLCAAKGLEARGDMCEAVIRPQP